jgi:hypothetical protein
MLGRAPTPAGAALAVAGGVVTLIFNALHPHPSDPTPDAFLRAVAANDAWVTIHLGLIVGVLLIIGGLAALKDSLLEESGAILARLGLLTALLGGGVFLVNFAIDGLAMQCVARAWIDATPADKAAAFRVADALDRANFGLFSLHTMLLPGLTFILFGLAVALSSLYPWPLGWVAVLGGIGSFAAGVLQAYTGRSPLATILFVVCSMLVILWMLAMGVVMWRTTRRTASPSFRGLDSPISSASSPRTDAS